MHYLALGDVLYLHRRIHDQTGGGYGIRDLPALESALAQPRTTFDGADLYTTLPEKAACLAFSIIQNHPFFDGNKRVGHAAMETFLMLNGYELAATESDAEAAILNVASGQMSRAELADWIGHTIHPRV